MRYIAALLAGIFLAILPLVMLSFPDFAWEQSCLRSDIAVEANDEAGTVVSAPCWLMRDSEESKPVRIFTVAMLLLGCVAGGALASRIAETRRALVAFAGPCVGYAILLWLQESDTNMGPFPFPVAVVAGLAGVVGAVRWSRIPRLTNAWRTKRAKPRPPEA